MYIICWNDTSTANSTISFVLIIVYAEQLLCERGEISTELFTQKETRIKRGSRTPSPVAFVDRYLEKHISPITLTTNIKRNPLFSAMRADGEDNVKAQPSWTVREYNTQTTRANLGDYLKVSRKSGRLAEWMRTKERRQSNANYQMQIQRSSTKVDQVWRNRKDF